MPRQTHAHVEPLKDFKQRIKRHFAAGIFAEAGTMGAIGVLALPMNVFVAALLFAYWSGG